MSPIGKELAKNPIRINVPTHPLDSKGLCKKSDSDKLHNPASPSCLPLAIEKRNAAILEKHKEGMSVRAIAKLFRMGVMTVSDTINKVYENPESGKPYTQSSPAVLPLANREASASLRLHTEERGTEGAPQRCNHGAA